MREDAVSDAMLVPVSMKRMMSVMVMALVLFVSCQDATPTPLPTPVSYKSLYQTYQREREANPTRLEQTIDPSVFTAVFHIRRYTKPYQLQNVKLTPHG